MSEAKNTALGGRADMRYSHVTPPANPTTLPRPTTSMITATFILAALTLLIATDDSTAHDARRAIPVESKDRDTFTR